jgi:hypothetical protein
VAASIPELARQESAAVHFVERSVVANAFLLHRPFHEVAVTFQDRSTFHHHAAAEEAQANHHHVRAEVEDRLGLAMVHHHEVMQAEASAEAVRSDSPRRDRCSLLHDHHQVHHPDMAFVSRSSVDARTASSPR